jgi:hypothetical protein
MKEKEKMFREKIGGLVEFIGDSKGWDSYEILDVTLNEDDKYTVANITVIYREGYPSTNYFKRATIVISDKTIN